MKPTLFRFCLGLAALLQATRIPPIALGADITWSAPGNGNWNVPANWSPPRIPGPSDHARITPPGPATITLNADAQVAHLTLGGGAGNPTLVIPTTARRLVVTGELAILPGARLRSTGILTNGLIRVEGELAWTGGTLEGSAAQPVRLEVLAGGILSLTNEAPRTLRHATISNSGTLRWTLGRLNLATGDCLLQNAARFEIDRTTDGSFTASASGVTSLLENLPAGMISKSGAGDVTLDLPLLNQGLLQIDSGSLILPKGITNQARTTIAAGSTLDCSRGPYVQTAGSTLLTGGSLRATPSIRILAGSLEGSGILDAPVYNNGTVRPGTGPGLLRFSQSLDLAPQSLLESEIEGPNPDQFDRLVVDGRLQLDGHVHAIFRSRPNGFTPKTGDAFQILTAPAGRSGRFASFSQTAGPPWWILEELPDGARLSVAPEPLGIALHLEAPSTLRITAEQRVVVPVTLDFPNGDPAGLLLSAAADDPSLLPAANLLLAGSGRTRALTFQPNIRGTGATRITVTAAAPGGTSATASVLVEVTEAPIQGLQAYEPFDFPSDGALTSTTLAAASAGSVGFARPWSGSSLFRVERNSLAHPDLLSSGHHVHADARTTIQTAARDLSLPLGTPGTTRYLSFLVRADSLPAGGPSQPFFGLLLDTSVNPDFFIGKPGQGAVTRWVIEDAGGVGQQSSPGVISQGTPTLLVVKLEFEDGPDRVSLFVAPAPGRPEPGTPDALRTDRDLGTIRTLVLDSSDAWSVDEVRVGTTWESVTPNLAYLAPLELRPIADLEVEEDSTPTGLKAVLNGFIAPRIPAFTLLQAPDGMRINAASGIISWRPDESQGGQTYDVILGVHDTPEPPSREASTRFRIRVVEKNNAPQLAIDPAADLRPTRGSTFRLKLGARDNDIPENTFSFTKSGTSPEGLTISPSGDVEWPVPADYPLGLITASVQVTDNNPLAPEASRSLSRVYPFNLEVREPNADLVVQVVADGGLLRSTDSIPEGGTGTLHLRVVNRGPSSAPNVRLTLHSQLLVNQPPQIEFLGAQASTGACAPDAQGVLCQFEDLPRDASAEATLSLRFRLQGQASLDLHAQSALADPSPGNERLPIEIRVTAPAPANPEEWEFTEVESLGTTGNQVVMRADVNAKPHLAWFNPTDQTLQYAAPSGDDWSVRSVARDVIPIAGSYRDPAGNAADSVVDHQNLSLLVASPDPRFLFVHSPAPGIQRISLRSLGDSSPDAGRQFFTIDEAQGADALGSPVLLGTGPTVVTLFRRGDQLMRADVHVAIEAGVGHQPIFYEWIAHPAPIPLEGWRLTRRGTAIDATDTQTIVITAAASDGLIRLVAVRDLRSSGGGVIVTPIDLVADNDQAVLHHSVARAGGKLTVAYQRSLGGNSEIWLAEWDGLTWHRERIPIAPENTLACARPSLATGENPEIAAVCTEQTVEGNQRKLVRSWRIARRIQGLWTSEEVFRSETVAESLPDGTPPPPINQPFRPAVAFLSPDGVSASRELAAHTGWPSENLIFGRRRPRWDITALNQEPTETPAGSPSIALNGNQPSIAWTTTTPGNSWKLNRAKRVNATPGGLERNAIITMDDPSGTAGTLLGPLAAEGNLLAQIPKTNIVWNLVSADPGTQRLQLWQIRESVIPDAPDFGWLPALLPDALHAAPGGPVLVPSSTSNHVFVAGINADRLPAAVLLPTDSFPPVFPIPAANSVSPRSPRLIRAAFARGNPSGLNDILYAVYFSGGPPWTLRVAEFSDGQWTRDVPLADVFDLFSGPLAVPLATDQLPWLAVDWALHPPRDAGDAPGWLYIAYPQGIGSGEQTIRVLRVDLSRPDSAVQQVDLARLPSPIRNLQALHLRTIRETMRLAYAEGGRIHVGSAQGIMNFRTVQEMPFETLPLNDAAQDFDMAFDGNNTWFAIRGTGKILVSGLGRFPPTEDALSGDLHTPVRKPPSQLDRCYLALWDLLGDLLGDSGSSSPSQSSTHRSSVHQTASSGSTSVRELDQLREVRAIMLRTAEGQRLEALYRQFSPDATVVAAANPTIFVDTIATVRNFLPGLMGYVTGTGGRFIITRGMIDQLNHLWDRLATRGSPALRAALLSERARYHGFEDFVGKDFDQWATLLQFPMTRTDGAAFRIVASERTATGFSVLVETGGSTPRLERADRLASDAWAPVPDARTTTEGNRIRLTDPAPPAGSAFYRVATLPAATGPTIQTR